MSGKRVSYLPAGTKPDGAEKLVAVQSGATVALTLRQIADAEASLTYARRIALGTIKL